MLFRNIRKFRCHAHRSVFVLDVILFSSHAHPTFSKSQIEKLVYIRVALHQNVFSDDSDVCRMVLNVDCHITRLYEQVADTRLWVLKHQFSIFVVNTLAVISDRRQKLIHLIAQSSLRQCYV